jgi:hypothetical protein
MTSPSEDVSELVRRLRDASDGWSGDAACIAAEIGEQAALALEALQRRNGELEKELLSAQNEAIAEAVKPLVLAAFQEASEVAQRRADEWLKKSRDKGALRALTAEFVRVPHAKYEEARDIAQSLRSLANAGQTGGETPLLSKPLKEDATIAPPKEQTP